MNDTNDNGRVADAGGGAGGGGEGVEGGMEGRRGEEWIRKDILPNVKPQTSISSLKCSVRRFQLHADQLRLVPEVLHALVCSGQRKLVSSTEQHTPGDLRS